MTYDDLYGDDGHGAFAHAESLEKSTTAIDDFFAKLEVQNALGQGSGTQMSKAEQSEFVGLDFSELRNFAESESRSIRKNGISREGLKASLAALGSILRRTAEKV